MIIVKNTLLNIVFIKFLLIKIKRLINITKYVDFKMLQNIVYYYNLYYYLLN